MVVWVSVSVVIEFSHQPGGHREVSVGWWLADSGSCCYLSLSVVTLMPYLYQGRREQGRSGRRRPSGVPKLKAVGEGDAHCADMTTWMVAGGSSPSLSRSM